MALDPVIAQAVGAGDDQGVRLGLQRGLFLAVLTFPASALMLPAGRILHWLSQPLEVIPSAALYDLICAPGIFPFLAFLDLKKTRSRVKSRTRPAYTLFSRCRKSGAAFPQ